MAVIQGVFTAASGLPTDGATCKLWTLAQFGGTQPSKDTALPVGSPVATLSGGTGTTYGGNGHYRFSGVSAGDYVVSIEWSGAKVYDSVTVPADTTFRDFTYYGGSVGGTGAANLSALNTALADTATGVLVIPPGTYTIAGSPAINNRTGLLILGYGATFSWSGTGTSTSPVAINITGTCRDLAIKGLRFLGDGTAANYHGGVKVLTGVVCEGLTIENCHFENVAAGVWLVNASILTRHIKVVGNEFENTIGTGAGQGRGVSVNVTSGEPLDLTIEKNHFDTTALYAVELLCGINLQIRDNFFRYHRSAASTGLLVPAVYCPMNGGRNVAITGNHFENCSDGMIGVVPAGGAISAVRIEGNLCIGAQTDEPDITVGSTNPAANGSVEMLTVRGNQINRSDLTTPCVLIHHALEAIVAHNVMENLLLTAANTAFITITGSGDSGGTSVYTDDLVLEHNVGMATLSGGGAIGIDFGSALCTSSAHVRAAHNAFFGVGAFFLSGASITNDNLGIGYHAIGAATLGITFDAASQPLEQIQYKTTFLFGLRIPPVSKNTNATLTNKETVVWATGGAGGIDLTLPVIGSAAGQVADGTLIAVTKIDSGAGTVELLPQGSDTILWGTSSAGLILPNQHSAALLLVDDTNNVFRVVGTVGVPVLHEWKSIATGDSPYTLALQDDVINADTAAGNIEIDLYSVTGREGRRVRIYRPSASNTLTIDPDGTEQVDGAGAGTAVTLAAAAGNWWEYQVAAGEWKRVGGRY
jgi:hypothetical protein